MTLRRIEAGRSPAIAATPAAPGHAGRDGRDGRAAPGQNAAPGQIRRYRRFRAWDYARGASLFVTIVTEPRRPLFGEVLEGGVLALSPLGKIVEGALLAMPRLNPGIQLFEHVVMPDHVHLSLAIAPGLEEPLKALGKAIGRFKNYTTKQAKLLGLAGHSPAIAATPAAPARFGLPGRAGSDGQAMLGQVGLPGRDGRAAPGLPGRDGRAAPGLLWQQGCHDWLCPTRQKIEATNRYIAYNPLKWWLMHGIPGHLRIREPLASPRLDPGDYWKGVGNLGLLDPERPMVSLRVSMKVRDPAAIAAVVKRMEAAADKGYSIISGFISQGERAVLEMLATRKSARFVRMRPSCIPNARFKPESLFVQPLAEGRCLEIARGNDETEFSRGVCLDLNAEIVRIATLGEGLALHWREDGPHVLARHSPALAATPAAPGHAGRDGRDGRAAPGQKEARP